MFPSLDISTSGLIAQRTRLNVISSNIANMSSTRNEAGEAEPFQAKFVVLETDDKIKGSGGAMGVKVAKVETSNAEPRWKFEPGHQDAIQEGPRKGYVAYPNIDMTTEMVDSLEATRAYEANIGVIEITKSLAQQSLRILA